MRWPLGTSMKSYNLTKSQQAAFDSLEKAFLRCQREGLYIWSDYGTLSAVNGQVVEIIGPDESLKEPLDHNQVSIILSQDIRENADDKLFIKRRNLTSTSTRPQPPRLLLG